MVGIISRPDIIDYIIGKRRQNIQIHSQTNLISSAT